MPHTTRYRLGLDLGANSLGWCLVELNEANEPTSLIRMGVRIFRDGRNPKDQASLAVARRMARSMRRRRDRWLKRRRRFMEALVKHGLMPVDETERRALVALDPYDLRRRGLDELLPPFHVGRALFHLNQRRGFKSNRKTDRANEDDKGKIKSALREVRERLDATGVRTVGKWLAQRHDRREPVRARLRGQGAKAAYELYVGRDMVADEFDRIWAAQSDRQPDHFTAEGGDELREILLHQRPLRPVRPGRCTLDPEDERAPLALPSAQRFRILQELNNLRIETGLGQSQALTLEQRDLFAKLLEGQTGAGKRDKADARGVLKFDTMRRMLGLSDGTPFNLESAKREGLRCNATSRALSRTDAFGPVWHALDLAAQDRIVERLLEEESETAAVRWLIAETGLPEAAAIKVANSGLPDSHSSLGRRALARVLPPLQAAVIPYSAAVQAAGYAHHSQLHSGEYFGHSALPYYGELLQTAVGFGTGDPKHPPEKRYGRIANPTVHIGLNQVRRLVNAVIKRYGAPTQIALEVTRELKQNLEQKDRIQKEQAENQKRREEDRADLIRWNERDTGENLLRMKLWRELKQAGDGIARCPYTGKVIGQDRLFSDEVEIEHILPFSRTLDDSYPNKTLAFREANRYKKNHTPFEAFGESLHGFDWQCIEARANRLPGNKAWRFAPDAMRQFEQKHGADFLARHLTDTAHLSRSAKAYLSYVCHPNDVWVTPGRLTALLRGKWGLNKLLSASGEKERTDHRHHALDAATIAVTDRGVLQKMATLSGQERLEREKDRILVPEPWDGFRESLVQALPRVVVSYRPDHGHEAGMHNDTAYGLAEPYTPGQPSRVRRYVPLASLKSAGELTDWGVYQSNKAPRTGPDGKPRYSIEHLAQFIGDASGPVLAVRLTEFSKLTGITRLRKTEPLTVIPMARGPDERARPNEERDAPYKAYKGDGNYCVEIYRDDKGRWREHVVTSFEAAQVARRDPCRLRHRTLAQNGMPLVMRLCADDVIVLGDDEARTLYRVNNFSQNGQIFMAPLNEANTDARNRDKSDSFAYISKKASSLFDAKARRVFVTELGFVLDPGFKP